MTYADILNIILAKLNLTMDEAKYDNVLSKIPYLCDEALGDIANRGKPYYKMLIYDFMPDYVAGDVDLTSLTTNESIIATRFVTMPTDFLALTNEFIQRAPIKINANTLELEETGDYSQVEGREFRRLSSRQLLFPNEINAYRYLVPTVCRYPRFATGATPLASSDADLDATIEPSILELLPNYVVAELIRVDDLTLSTVYRNLYESALAALNDTILEPAGSLHSESW